MIIFPPNFNNRFRAPRTVEECDRRIKSIDVQLDAVDGFLASFFAIPLALIFAVVVFLILKLSFGDYLDTHMIITALISLPFYIICVFFLDNRMKAARDD